MGQTHITAIALSTILLCASCAERHATTALPSPPSPDLSEMIERVRSSIVQVKTNFGTGTGFFVGEEGIVITARHVVYRDPGNKATVASQIVVLLRIPTAPNIVASFSGWDAAIYRRRR